MKHVWHIAFRGVALIGITALLFSSCKKDKNLVTELTLEKTAIELFADDQMEIKINSGNGNYEIVSSADAVVSAQASVQSFIISAKGRGMATITVKDSQGKSATLTVTVKSAIIDASTARFRWMNTIELEKSNSWGLTVLADRIAVTNLPDKKQYVLSWSGGYAIGDKKNAKLFIIESGKTTEELEMTGLEIQKVENNLYSIAFNKDSQKGELVFQK